jgi:predicted permease
VRTFASLLNQPLGFDPATIVGVDVDAQRTEMPESARLALFERFREAAAAVPGVENAALSQILPLSGSGWNTVVNPSATFTAGDRQRMSWVNPISPEFLATYGMALVAGRNFIASDSEHSAPVVIVNEAFARKFFGGANPVGHEFRADLSRPERLTYTIVGLVRDTAYRRLREGVVPILFLPNAQVPQRSGISISVRTSTAARAAVASALTRALSGVDANASLTIRPLDIRIRGALAQERLVAILSVFFAALALGLAALGLYGVTSYGVQRRRFELGIRVALGADRTGIMRLVLARVTTLVLAGLAAGLTLAWWCSRFVSSTLLYGVTSRDTTTFFGAALVLAAVGVAAGWLPARRAARIDPVDALRDG